MQKTTTFISKRTGALGAIALGTVALLGIVAFGSVAHADTNVTSTILDSGGLATTTTAIGATVSDVVTVASSTSTSAPTGVVDFNLFPNTTCSSTATTQSGVALVNGMATSTTTTVPDTGLSFLVNYDGDASNTPAVSACESVTPIVVSTTTPSGPNAPEVITDPATNVTTSDATLNGTNGDNPATEESFWVSTSTINTSSSNIPAGVYSTPVLPAASANADFSDQLSLVTTEGITTGGVDANMSAITANTTYYYVAWALVDGTWYPGAVDSLMTTASTSTTTGTATISGEVYNDANRDGVLDNGETGLAGWTINLYDNAGWSGPTNIQPFMTTVSDANGDYSFANLPDGTYSIEEIANPGSGLSQFTSDISPVVISGGVSMPNENFGNVTGNPYSQNGNGNNGNGHGNNSGKGNGNGGNGNNGNGNGNNGNQGAQQHGNGFFGFLHDLGNFGGNHH